MPENIKLLNHYSEHNVFLYHHEDLKTELVWDASTDFSQGDLVSITFMLDAGSNNELGDESGLAHVMEHCWWLVRNRMKYFADYPTSKLNASTRKNIIALLECCASKKNVKALFELGFQMMDPQQFEKDFQHALLMTELKAVSSEIRRAHRPESALSVVIESSQQMLLNRMGYTNTNSTGGNLDIIKNATPEKISNLFKRLAHPSRLKVLVTGNPFQRGDKTPYDFFEQGCAILRGFYRGVQAVPLARTHSALEQISGLGHQMWRVQHQQQSPCCVAYSGLMRPTRIEVLKHEHKTIEDANTQRLQNQRHFMAMRIIGEAMLPLENPNMGLFKEMFKASAKQAQAPVYMGGFEWPHSGRHDAFTLYFGVGNVTPVRSRHDVPMATDRDVNIVLQCVQNVVLNIRSGRYRAELDKARESLRERWRCDYTNGVEARHAMLHTSLVQFTNPCYCMDAAVYELEDDRNPMHRRNVSAQDICESCKWSFNDQISSVAFHARMPAPVQPLASAVPEEEDVSGVIKRVKPKKTQTMFPSKAGPASRTFRLLPGAYHHTYIEATRPVATDVHEELAWKVLQKFIETNVKHALRESKIKVHVNLGLKALQVVLSHDEEVTNASKIFVNKMQQCLRRNFAPHDFASQLCQERASMYHSPSYRAVLEALQIAYSTQDLAHVSVFPNHQPQAATVEKHVKKIKSRLHFVADRKFANQSEYDPTTQDAAGAHARASLASPASFRQGFRTPNISVVFNRTLYQPREAIKLLWQNDKGRGYHVPLASGSEVYCSVHVPIIKREQEFTAQQEALLRLVSLMLGNGFAGFAQDELRTKQHKTYGATAELKLAQGRPLACFMVRTTLKNDKKDVKQTMTNFITALNSFLHDDRDAKYAKRFKEAMVRAVQTAEDVRFERSSAFVHLPVRANLDRRRQRSIFDVFGDLRLADYDEARLLQDVREIIELVPQDQYLSVVAGTFAG